MDFTVQVDHKVKLQKGEKKEKYLDLTKAFKKQWNMEVTVIPIVIDGLCTVIKVLVQGIVDFQKKDEWRPSKLYHR